MTHPICMTDGEFQFDHLPHYLSLGAGVQSSTLALMYATGELTPMPKSAIFADTQSEPASVYQWLDWLETQLPFPVHRVSKGSLEKGVLEMRKTDEGKVFSKSNIPMFTLNVLNGQKGIISNRSCTIDFKIKPILKFVRSDAQIKHGEKEIKCVSLIGISTDEIRRVKPSRKAWVINRWPLVEKRYSRAMCVAWMRDRGFPEPPRSSCVFCPYHSNKEWRRLQTEEPEEFQRAVEFEKNVQESKKKSTNFKTTPFLHSSCKPLDEVDFRSDVERGQMLFWDDECEGMCGV